MTQGFMAIFLTPSAEVLPVPDGWIPDYTSDTFEAREKMEDRFVDFDHQPTTEEIAAQMSGAEFQAELRQWEAVWRLRIRYPVSYTTENRCGVSRIYCLEDAKIPAGWGRKICFWWVNSSAAKLKLLHQHIYTTLGYGPIAGALAVLDPNDQTKFLDKAVQTATGLTNAQQLARVTAIKNALVNLGYEAPLMSALVASPTGKTEDDLIRALVSDLGGTMARLRETMIRME